MRLLLLTIIDINSISTRFKKNNKFMGDVACQTKKRPQDTILWSFFLPLCDLTMSKHSFLPTVLLFFYIAGHL